MYTGAESKISLAWQEWLPDWALTYELGGHWFHSGQGMACDVGSIPVRGGSWSMILILIDVSIPQ